jgi:hypothetical protein
MAEGSNERPVAQPQGLDEIEAGISAIEGEPSAGLGGLRASSAICLRQEAVP